MDQQTYALAETLWNYHLMKHQVATADAILVLCSHAERFARLAVSLGVPRENILTETQSTNTGENVKFTKRLLGERGLDPQTFIVVQKPYMERRAYATFRQFWPEKDLVVTSPQVSFREYLDHYTNRALSVADVVGIM